MAERTSQKTKSHNLNEAALAATRSLRDQDVHGTENALLTDWERKEYQSAIDDAKAKLKVSEGALLADNARRLEPDAKSLLKKMKNAGDLDPKQSHFAKKNTWGTIF